VPGHEIVGRVARLGAGLRGLEAGRRVGVPWLGHSCGHCPYCRSERENLCDDPAFTGFSRDGGYASHVLADAAFVYPLDETSDAQALAPLLCAGLIGWRCLKLGGDGPVIGLYGFGAAAHILTQLAVSEGRRVFAFTRADDDRARQLARDVGAEWAGSSDDPAPERLDAALIFAPAGYLVPRALEAVDKGGIVICGGIHMSDIPAFPYRLLWEERRLVSVANLTRADGIGLMRAATRTRLHVHATPYPLEDANVALADLRAGRIAGAAVLRVSGDGMSTRDAPPAP